MHGRSSVRAAGYGALLLSTLLLWAYLHAMQYIIIWAGNIPDEVIWYLRRATGGWALCCGASSCCSSSFRSSPCFRSVSATGPSAVGASPAARWRLRFVEVVPAGAARCRCTRVCALAGDTGRAWPQQSASSDRRCSSRSLGWRALRPDTRASPGRRIRHEANRRQPARGRSAAAATASHLWIVSV